MFFKTVLGFLLGIYKMNVFAYVEKKIYIERFITVLFLIVRSWKQIVNNRETVRYIMVLHYYSYSIALKI